MRIQPLAIQPFAREHGKPAGRGHADANAATGSDTPAATRTPKPASDSVPSSKVQTQNETKTAPPGLERALSHLEPARNAGQARAYDRISSHIARYLENQALVPSSATASATQPKPETAATSGAPATSEPVSTAGAPPPSTPTPAVEPAASAAAPDTTGSGSTSA